MAGVKIVAPLEQIGGVAPSVGDHLRWGGAGWVPESEVDADEVIYGDVMPAFPRRQVNGSGSLPEDSVTVLTQAAVKTFTATRLRFALFGLASGAATWQASIRDATNPLSHVLLSNVTATPADLTDATGDPLRDLPLAQPVDIVAGRRYSLLLHFDGGAFTGEPSFGIGSLFNGPFVNRPSGVPINVIRIGAAAPGAGPYAIDGTWNAVGSSVWWALR
jgi:hypothetical protein